MKDIYDTKIGLLTALHTIQETCKNHTDSDCYTCPLRVDKYPSILCGIRSGEPKNWDINDVMDWRAFK